LDASFTFGRSILGRSKNQVALRFGSGWSSCYNCHCALKRKKFEVIFRDVLLCHECGWIWVMVGFEESEFAQNDIKKLA